MTYANEKFQQAVYLAVGAGPIKERVGSPTCTNCVRGHSRVFPGELAERALALHDALTKVDAEGDEGKLAATLAGMSDDEGSDGSRPAFSRCCD